MTRSRAALGEAAFTLIEVTLALMILGGSLIVLLGLQSSIIERTIRDSRKQRAMLLAREILAAIESSADAPQLQTTDGSVQDVFEALLSSADRNSPESYDDKDFHAHLEVVDIGIPNVATDAMRKATLTISWGPQQFDQLTAVYFTQSE